MSVIRTPEGHFVLAHDSHLSRWVEEHKRLDIAEGQIAFYAQHIPLGGTVLDAGACIGDHTATLARLVGPTGKVIAMEPNPEAYEALRLNFLGAPQVVTLNEGLAATSGHLRMKREQNAGASFIDPTGDVNVSVVIIDSLCLDRLDFMHLDLEGFEPKALRGGEATIKRLRPVIVLEVCHSALERNGSNEAALRAQLDGLGYDVQEIEPHHGPHLPQRDIIAFPRK